MRMAVYKLEMYQRYFSHEFKSAESDRFYNQEWSVFVREVDQMTGGSPVARQLFFDARSKYLADKD